MQLMSFSIYRWQQGPSQAKRIQEENTATDKQMAELNVTAYSEQNDRSL